MSDSKKPATGAEWMPPGSIWARRITIVLLTVMLGALIVASFVDSTTTGVIATFVTFAVVKWGAIPMLNGIYGPKGSRTIEKLRDESNR